MLAGKLKSEGGYVLKHGKPQGGTELLHQNLMKYLGEEQFNDINLIVNTTNPTLIKKDKVNILWNHHCHHQPAVNNISKRQYTDLVDYFVYVSHWQLEKYRYKFGVPESKSMVIKNAIPPIDLVEKPKKIKLIYTSTPWRGLDVLLDCFERLNRDDVELDVYSSTIIYGYIFYMKNESRYKELFDRAKGMKNVNYMGYATNDVIRSVLQRSHILAYPSTWEETSCLSAIEAAMAGCHVVTTNLGALYETLAEWATYVCIDRNRENLVHRYTLALEEAINNFWLDSTQEKLIEQHHYFRRFWTWDTRANDWRKFLAEVRKEKGI